MPAELARACWPDVAAGRRRVLVVPVGSLEQHGPHLPLDTDTRIAVAVAERAVAERAMRSDADADADADATADAGGIAVAPAIAIGASGEHAGFPGTLSVGTAALTSCLIELGRHASLHWPALLLVNGHGGNADAIDAALATLAAEDRDASAWHASVPGGDAHAGRTETSLMLAIAPGDVRLSQAVAGNTRPLAELMPVLRERGVRAVSGNGVLGDPAGASAAEGERLLAGLVRALSAALTGALAAATRQDR